MLIKKPKETFYMFNTSIEATSVTCFRSSYLLSKEIIIKNIIVDIYIELSSIQNPTATLLWAEELFHSEFKFLSFFLIAPFFQERNEILDHLYRDHHFTIIFSFLASIEFDHIQ